LASDAATGYGTAEHWSARMKGGLGSPEEMDAKMPKKMRDICNQWIVATYQMDEMENAAGALVCARVLRMFLIFFIVTSTIGLCVGFFLKASLAAPMESEQYGELAAPDLVVCPSPWGSAFLGFNFKAAEKGLVPGTAFKALDSHNYSYSPFDPTEVSSGDSEQWLHHCMIMKFNDVMLKPHGKVAQYTAFETVALTFNAQSEDGKFNYGFCNGDNRLPQRWFYGALGSRITGEISYDQVNVGASDVSEGIPRSILGFKGTGNALLGSDTRMEYFYGYFMVRVLSAQAKGLTVFAVIAFVLLLAAAVNNCGLFELFFVEYVPDDEPQPSLEPNLFCQAFCGKWFSSCRRRKAKPEDEEDPAEADAEGAAGAEAPPVKEEPPADSFRKEPSASRQAGATEDALPNAPNVRPIR